MKTEEEILNEYKKTFFINEINERLKDISELLTNNSLSKDDLQINLYDLPELNDEYTMNLSQDSVDKLIDKFIRITNLLKYIENSCLISRIKNSNIKIPTK